MKIVTVVGARPQFIKASALSREFKDQGVDEVLVHTGQHYDENMSDIFFSELGIAPPRYNLEVKSSLHGEMTGRMLEGIEHVLLVEKPSWVVVYGDTNSTIAAALAAAKLNIPVAHVEAGLRSFNRTMPEEINRVLTDHLSTLLFAPTWVSKDNLIREGIEQKKIEVVGDIMFDVSLHYGGNSQACLKKNGLKEKEYILATCHRQENTNDERKLRAIFEALVHVSTLIPVICPLHPRTKKYLSGAEWFKPGENFKIIDPLGYIDMVALEKSAKMIVTDSGGVQKEAFFHKVPCITLRDETEWVELISSGWNILTPPQSKEIVQNAILANLELRGQDLNLYGDGCTAKHIVKSLKAMTLSS
ncbi:UDP-2,3-diacetamido-2,3-dideoxy-D-glucuronate 2-epimerase [compost metagenome]